MTTFDESAQANAFGMLGGNSSHFFGVHAKKALWHVWAWGEKKPRYRGSLPEKMTAMTFSPDAVLCFGGSQNGSIWVWQMGSGCLLRFWPAHFREVTQLIVSQDQTFLVSCSADATVHVYNLADIFAEQTPKPFHSWSGHALAVTSIVLLPGSGMQQAVASASLDRSVRIWDIGTGKPLLARTCAAPVHCIAAGPAGSEILCACKTGELRSFSTASAAGASDGFLAGHTGPVLSCSLSADGSLAASCSEADRVRIWDMRTRQCIAQAHTSRNVQVAAVQIVQRPTCALGLPAFHAFQRILATPEDTSTVPVSVGGRASRLQQAMEEHASVHSFVDRVLWGQASGLCDLAGAQELEERRVAAEVGQMRWAAVAADLYGCLVEDGLDAPKIATPPVQPDSAQKSLTQHAPADQNTIAANETFPQQGVCSGAKTSGVSRTKRKRRGTSSHVAASSPS